MNLGKTIRNIAFFVSLAASAAYAQPKIVPALNGALILTDNEKNSLNEGNRIIINIPSYKLYFCRDNEIVKEYPISIGPKGKPSPEGFFKIDLKKENPDYSPLEGSSYKNIADYFPPGKNNPFGTRTMHLQSHFYIHGIPESKRYLIGQTKEDGCIGLLNEDIEEIFSYANTGIPVDIFYRLNQITNKNSSLNFEKFNDLYSGFRRIIVNQGESKKKIKKVIPSEVNLEELKSKSPENWNLDRKSLDEIIVITDEDYNYENKSADLIAGGDVMLGWFMDDLLNSGKSPFSNLEEILENHDISFCNLEAPFTTQGRKLEKKFNFRINPERVRYLKDAGFDIVSLANNHSMDYGKEGLIDTIDTLNNSEILYSGAGINIGDARKIKIIERKGIKFAFLGYSTAYSGEFCAGPKNPGIAYANNEWIKEDINKARNLADIVIVSYHGGTEKSYSPTERQKELARLAINSGANIVLGHHPHVLQGIEEYKKGLIAYSLGNFAFGAYRGSEIREGVLLQIKVNKFGIQDYSLIPIDISPKARYQPKLLEGKEKQAVLDRINKYSEYIK